MLPIRTVLYATDFSPTAKYAFNLACALARDYGAKLVMLHVKPLPVYGGEWGVVIPPDPEGLDEELHAKMDALKPVSNEVVVEKHLREGEPAPHIVRLAEECHADVVVLGTHGRTGLGRLLLGSVAEEVLRKAPCPVLTIKTPAAFAEKDEAEAAPEHAHA